MVQKVAHPGETSRLANNIWWQPIVNALKHEPWRGNLCQAESFLDSYAFSRSILNIVGHGLIFRSAGICRK